MYTREAGGWAAGAGAGLFQPHHWHPSPQNMWPVTGSEGPALLRAAHVALEAPEWTREPAVSQAFGLGREETILGPGAAAGVPCRALLTCGSVGLADTLNGGAGSVMG